MKFILGKKMNMTQIWENDKVIGVTQVLVGPCVVSQVKTKDNDGYEALQLAFGDRKEKNIKKPQLGHVKGLNIKPRHMKEFRTDSIGEIKLGDTISIGTFVVGDIVNISATSKGKGFQGVVKRHGFKGQQKTHGNKDQLRMPGSVGAMGPAHVFKGTRMGGRMGGKKITSLNLEIVKIDEDNNIIFLRGAVPGAINGLVMIKGKGDLKVNMKPVVELKEEGSKEEVATEIEDEIKEDLVTKEEIKEDKKEETLKKEVSIEVKKEEKTEESKKEENKEETPKK